MIPLPPPLFTSFHYSVRLPAVRDAAPTRTFEALHRNPCGNRAVQGQGGSQVIFHLFFILKTAVSNKM